MNEPHLSIFDLDRTLFKVNSSYRFGSYLYQQKFFGLKEMITLVGYYALHKMGFFTIAALHQRNFEVLFSGRALADFQRHATAFLDRYWDECVYSPAIKKLDAAKQHGHYTVILSGSPDFLVAPIAQRLGVDEWQATRYAVDVYGKLSGISYVLEGDGKSDYVSILSERLGIARASSTAYSDSILDEPLLLAAGNAVGVNPDRKLRALCRRRQWEII